MLRSVTLIAAAIMLSLPATAAESSGPSQVVVHQHGHGWTLSDDKGMTLYTFEKDIQPGKSSCSGNCAKQWPPLLVTADADRAGGEWSIITRDDGSKQWAYRGKPLYLYGRDSVPGDANGDGVGNQWQVGFKSIATPPGIGIQRTLIGYVLTDEKRLTLYSFDKDRPDGSGCDVDCTQTWMPMLAPTIAHGITDWMVLTRNDGTRQWAFKGKPVYRYAGDVHPAETSGEKVDKDWHAVILEPPPPNPTWITIQQSDAGELLADAQGQTLYSWVPDRQFTIVKGSLDNPAFDRPEDWIPVLAPDDAKPIGSWSVIDRGGKKQWAYKGNRLYTNKNDVAPGDLYGLRGGDFHFQPIMRSGRGWEG